MKKKPVPLVVSFSAGLTALVAISSAVVYHVDPVTSLARGAVAYIVARSLAALWCSLFGTEDVETMGEQGSALSEDVSVTEPAEAAA